MVLFYKLHQYTDWNKLMSSCDVFNKITAVTRLQGIKKNTPRSTQYFFVHVYMFVTKYYTPKGIR